MVVLRRARWAVLGLIMLGCAVTGQSAAIATLLVGLIIALGLCAAALRALNVEDLSIRSLLAFSRQRTSWSRLLGAVLLLIATVAVVRFATALTAAAKRLAHLSGGDPDLMVALFAAALGALIAGAAWTLCVLGARAEERPLAETGRPSGAATVREQDDRSAGTAAYWQEATVSLTLAAVALVPAALLANWAWNVIASVLLPVFVLSIRDALSRQDASTTSATQQSGGSGRR